MKKCVFLFVAINIIALCSLFRSPLNETIDFLANDGPVIVNPPPTTNGTKPGPVIIITTPLKSGLQLTKII